jgi:hypothetical protein
VEVASGQQRASPNRLFGDMHCDEILYRIKISTDKFDYPEFIKDIQYSPKEGVWPDILCPSRDDDYHAHISWMDEKAHVRLQIGFYAHKPEEGPRQNVVYAEECVQTVGKFFANNTTEAHLHADFEFKSGRQSRLGGKAVSPCL